MDDLDKYKNLLNNISAKVQYSLQLQHQGVRPGLCVFMKLNLILTYDIVK